LGSVASIAGVPEGTPREYALGDEPGPWVPDPATVELPEGPLHFGLEVRGGVKIGLLGYGATLLFGGEFSGMLDYRVAPRFHVRAGAVVGIQSTVSGPGTDTGALGARLLVGFDLARLFILRIGGEVGGEWVPTFGGVNLYGGPEIDMLGQLTDGGNLEIGLALSFIFANAFNSGPRLQVLAGWSF
jgi:hypothetical protein